MAKDNRRGYWFNDDLFVNSWADPWLAQGAKKLNKNIDLENKIIFMSKKDGSVFIASIDPKTGQMIGSPHELDTDDDNSNNQLTPNAKIEMFQDSESLKNEKIKDNLQHKLYADYVEELTQKLKESLKLDFVDDLKERIQQKMPFQKFKNSIEVLKDMQNNLKKQVLKPVKKFYEKQISKKMNSLIPEKLVQNIKGVYSQIKDTAGAKMADLLETLLEIFLL